MPPSKGQRQARGIARQERILDAAFELFATYGYRATTLAKVADAVGLTEAGVVHHFGSKEALFQAVLGRRDVVDPDAEAWVAEASGALEALQRLPRLARTLVEHPRLARFDAVVGGESLSEAGPDRVHFDARFRQIRQALATMVTAGKKRGEIRPDIDAQRVAAEIVAFMAGIQTQWLHDPSIDLVAAYEHYVAGMVDSLRVR